MSGTHTKLVYHIIFSTKHRAPLLGDSIRDEVHRYLGGIILGEQGVPIQVGGTSDHVHLLVQLTAVAPLADLMRRLKSNSSKWLNDGRKTASKFGWQDGYAAFTVSESQIERIRQYIVNQEEHHRRSDFKTELRALLERHGIEFDEQRLWD